MKKAVVSVFIVLLVFSGVVKAQTENFDQENGSARVTGITDDGITYDLARRSNLFTFDQSGHSKNLMIGALFPIVTFDFLMLLALALSVYFFYKNKSRRNKIILIIFIISFLSFIVFSFRSVYFFDQAIKQEIATIYYLYDDAGRNFWEAKKKNEKCSVNNDCAKTICSESGEGDIKICDNGFCSCLYGPIDYPVGNIRSD